MDTVSPIMYVVLAILIGMSAFFSGTETAFATVNKIRIKDLISQGNKKAVKVLRIAEDYDRALSAILIGNNVVNIASASIATVICTTFWKSNGALISTVAMTLIVLMFGEILPKSLAKENAEKFTLAVVNILDILIKVLAPFIWFFLNLKKLVSKSADGDDKPSVTERELKFIIEESHNEGVLEQQESELVQSALDFDEITVEEILTPRVDVVAIEDVEDIEEIKEMFFTEGYSRIPVYHESIDKIIGIIHSKDFFKAYVQNNHFDINTIIQKVVYVPPKKHISELLQELQRVKSHMAIVTDQYGGTIGIITLEDVIEELVGDILDESDEEEVDIIKIDENTFEVLGDTNLEDFFDYIDYEYNDYDEEDRPNSFAGLALEQLEKIPENGEFFYYESFHICIKEVSDNRIKKLIVKTNTEEPVDDSAENEDK